MHFKNAYICLGICMYLNSYLYVSEKLKQNNLKQQSNNAYTVFKSAQMTLNALNVCSNFPHLKKKPAVTQ